jgi:hypothetical protein
MDNTFSLTFETGNAAFEDGNAPFEIAAILRNAAAKIEAGARAGVAYDSNGNKVGRFEWERDDD